MARSSKKNRLEFYRHELDRARTWRLENYYEDTWERLVDLYRGRVIPTTHTEEDRVVVNVAFGTINVIYPSVSVNYPKITVLPNKPDDEDRAVIMEAITNYNWKHFNYQDQFRLAVKDYLIIGHGWVKCGYTMSEKEVPLDSGEKADALKAALAEADTFAMGNPGLAASVPTNDEIISALPATKMIVHEDQPYIERVSPFDVFVDVEATCMEDARWIAQRIVRPIEDVRKDERYKPGVRARVEADMGTDRIAEQQRSYFRHGNQDPEDQRITVWEWYDVKNNTFAVFAENNTDEFLVDPMTIPFDFGHPFVMIRNYDVPDFFYPMGDLEAIEPLIDELNKTRSISVGVRKKFARKVMAHAGAFDAAGRAALESDVDNQVVWVANENAPLSETVIAMPMSPVPPELFAHSETVEKDIGDVSGVSEYQRGQVPETRRTATEAAIISDNVNARSADKLAQVEKAIARIARRVVQLQQQFLSSEQVARVTGPDAMILWIPYNREDIKGEFDYDVEAGSTQPMNETVRRQTATALMEAMGPFIDMGVVDPMVLAEHVLRDGFGVPNPTKFMTQMAGMMPGMQPPGMPPQPGMPPGMDPSMGGTGGPQGAPMGAGFEDASGMPGNMLPGGAMF